MPSGVDCVPTIVALSGLGKSFGIAAGQTGAFTAAVETGHGETVKLGAVVGAGPADEPLPLHAVTPVSAAVTTRQAMAVVRDGMRPLGRRFDTMPG